MNIEIYVIFFKKINYGCFRELYIIFKIKFKNYLNLCLKMVIGN